MSRSLQNHALSRRDFVEEGLATTLLCTAPVQLLAAAHDTTVSHLKGPNVRLDIGYAEINVSGERRRATSINGSLPGPTLRWREGDRVRITMHNHLEETTSIHWQGLILPTEMDGVPGISPGLSGIAPGTTFTYEFDIRQTGTYWCHSHSGFQEQTGMYGAIIIEPRKPTATIWDRESIVPLSDWSDEDPNDVFRTLKRNPESFNVNPRTLAQTIDDFRIAPAETYDVIVEPQESNTLTIFSQAIDHGGYALGTLTSHPGEQGSVPPLDPPPLLRHADMGMESSRGAHAPSGADPANSHHAHHVHHSAKPQMGSGTVGYGSNLPIEHDPAEYGPHVDMRA